LVGNKV